MSIKDTTRALAPNQVTKDLYNSQDRSKVLLSSSSESFWIRMMTYGSSNCSGYEPKVKHVVVC
jgi:hypothetical protein